MIFHILQVRKRREIAKIVNLGKEIKNDKKCNEKKLGLCMNVFINFDPNLDLFIQNNDFKKDQISKE